MSKSECYPRILVIHGPNLNFLGQREKGYYGILTLDDINSQLLSAADKTGCEIDIRQSNYEGDLVTWIQTASEMFHGVLINPAGYSHTSVAIRDAVILSRLPIVEVHLSNIHSRELFRQRSLIAPVCIGQISGFKEESYLLGLKALISYILQQDIEN